MEAPQIQTGFDQQERERVRRALLRYMAEQRIGTPRLQGWIIKADKPRHREIPLSTLQRFLAGRHHTQDHHVALCQAFVRELPYYGEGRDIALFGTALSGFLHEPAEGKSRESLGVPSIESFVGEFVGRSKHRTMRGRSKGDSEVFLVASHASLIAVPGQPFLEMRERALDTFGGRDRHFSFEGVLVVAAPLFYAVLRNNLTRQPKVYSLEPVPVLERGVNVLSLQGRSFEVVVPDDRRIQRFSRSTDMRFFPTATEQHLA